MLCIIRIKKFYYFGPLLLNAYFRMKMLQTTYFGLFSFSDDAYGAYETIQRVKRNKNYSETPEIPFWLRAKYK